LLLKQAEREGNADRGAAEQRRVEKLRRDAIRKALGR
tara:strand:- start:2132 stop:2242 length:111 start_codon:yes stop_codon:yes gene_type:complete